MVFERKEVELTAVVTVPKLYPVEPSSFVLSMKAADGVETDGNLRALTAEVNAHHGELTAEQPAVQLLSLQLRRLQMCLDVYHETEVKPTGQGRTAKLLCRGIVGPDQLRPYLYDPAEGVFVHRTLPEKPA